MHDNKRGQYEEKMMAQQEVKAPVVGMMKGDILP
jgi:hypothetical protein